MRLKLTKHKQKAQFLRVCVRRIGNMKKVIIIFAALFLMSSSTVFSSVENAEKESETSSLTAEQIFDRVAYTYENCNSYQDTGLLIDVYTPAVAEEDKIYFMTSFIRPDRFRFEYQKKIDNAVSRYIIWVQGEDVKSWWDIKHTVINEPSLEHALVAAKGVSLGTSYTIPALLLSKQLSGSLLYMKKRERIEDDQLNGVACYQIRGNYGGRSIIVWIDKKTFLIRQIKSEWKLLWFITIHTTVTYDPIINVDISEDQLQFKAPPVR